MSREVLSLLWVDHPEMTQEWYLREKARLPDDVMAREIDINYSLSARGVVFKEFKEAHIIRGEFVLSPNLPVVRFHDYGKTYASLFSQKDNFGNLTFFHEIVGINETDPTGKQARAVVSYSANLVCQGFIDHDDPAGSSDNYVNSEETSYKVMAAHDIHPTHAVQGAHNARRRNRVDITKRKLAEFPEGSPVIRVHERCRYLIDALQSGYRYREDSKTKEITDDILEEHPHEDLADCFGGTIVEQLTVETSLPIPRRQRRQGNPYTGYHH